MFRYFKAPRKLWCMILETNQDRGRSNTPFYWLQNSKEGKTDIFRGKIERSSV